MKVRNSWADETSVGLTPQAIRDYHRQLYGTTIVPRAWVFNDFGHATVYLYIDRNGNRRRDGSEPIRGEFIHTTPPDEARTHRRLAVMLTESHGCVHVKPNDIDDMIQRRFVAKNNLFVVHGYSEVPAYAGSPTGRPPYELHFFPGARQLCVLGRV